MRAPRCHCGLERTRAAAPPAPARPERLSLLAGTPGRRSLVAAAAAAGGLWLFAAAGPATRDLPEATSAARPSPGPFRYPELPVLSTEEAWAPARPAPAADEWARARALLERSLGDIAAGTESLKRRYDPFAATCLAAAISSSPLSPRPGVDWLASLKTAQRVRSGTLLAEDGSATDCEEAWRRLVTRADALFSDLQAAASLARARSVSPEHWRMLLADHHLVVWDGY